MKRIHKGKTVLTIGLATLYAIFIYWYGGKTTPLTIAEVDVALAKSGNNDPEQVERMRQLSENDDGREFYMVNLIKHRDKAIYPEGYDYDDDVDAAAARYNNGFMPRVLKRASFAIIMAEPTQFFLQPEGAQEWDSVAIVRYRSRRDLLEMVTEDGFDDIVVHKWASVKDTQVMPSKPIITFVWVRSLVAGIFALSGGLLHLILRRFSWFNKS